MKLLLVDDEDGIREGLALLLRRRGHDVRTAADCAAARSALADEFDAVVTDWRLPDGVAGDFLALARCPVLAISGHPDEIGGDHAFADVLTKPVLPARLAAALAALAPAPPAAPPLPPPAAAALPGLLAGWPATATVRLYDDGVQATLVADLPPGVAPPPAVAGAEVAVAHRRDGVRVTCRWPHGNGDVAPRGGHPAEPADPVHGTAHAMPMKPQAGDPLPAELAELWSEP
ncbi:MAG: response regulator [Planctomycetota bacterium]